MRDILRASGRAMRSLGRRGVLIHLLWPSFASLLLWVVLAIFLWAPLVDGVAAWAQQWPFVGGLLASSEIGAAVVLLFIKVTLGLTLLPLMYVTAVLLLAVFALPMMLEQVALRDYADLDRRMGGSNLGSLWNAAIAGLVFLVGMVVSVPFWLIPGAGLVASVLLTGWLNQRAFGYDALMFHADRAEIVRLQRSLRAPMLLLGGGCALLAYVPVINLVAPAFCALAFVHFMLESLRRERATRGVSVLDPASGAGT